MPKLHLVALGSSFAAGPGIPPLVDRRAMRSGQNYSHLLAASLDAQLTDLTSSGATLLNILNTPQKHLFSGESPPQLYRVPKDAGIVTLTAGGNDLSYSGGMLADAYRASISNLPFFGRLLTQLCGSSTQVPPLTADELTSRFLDVIDGVSTAAPQAKIILVEYLTVFSPSRDSDSSNWLTQARLSYYHNLADVLRTAYRKAAEARPHVSLIPMSTISLDHGVGTDEPWVTGFDTLMLARGIIPYHPNLLGHRKVAHELKELLDAESTTLLNS